MMPTARGMSQMVPSHVLRVGQTIRLEAGVQETALRQHAGLAEPGGDHDHDLDVSLDDLNQLILELDPTFQPIQVNRSPARLSPPADVWDAAASRLPPAPGGCSPRSLPIGIPSGSPGRRSPSYGGVSCSPHGALVFCGSPAASLPPLPGGREARRAASPRPEQGSLRLSHSNRNSTASLLSTSTCSDTSYMLGSSLSLTGEDADSQDFLLSRCSFSDGSRTPESRPGLDKPRPLRRAQRSPASLSGSLSDIPILLVNGELQPDRQQWSPGPAAEHLGPSVLSVSSPGPSPSHRFQAHFSGSQPSMKFVMDTSKFWFRPHINRAQAEALVQEKEAGAFVMRDSTSHRGSFGLAMKVDQAAANASASASPGESSADLVRHFLIESSARGVRVKGSSQEPYFGSLSALVYQHTISAYALPCKLLLHSRDVGAAEESATHKPASEDKSRTACNFVYLNAVATEMLTGPCAVQRAVGSTLEAPGGFTPTIVNLKVSLKGVTLTDINRKLFFRRHYPSHLLSYSGEDPDNRLWTKGSSVGARMFGFVAKGVEAGMENVCHVFAEYERLQSCNEVIQVIQAAIAKP